MESTNDFRSRLLKEDLFYRKAEKYAEKTKHKNNIIIWGCSSGGQLVFDFCKKYGFASNVKYYADNNKEKWRMKLNGLLVLSPEEVEKKVQENPDTYIIIASQRLDEIKNQLFSLGVEESAIDVEGFGLAWGYMPFKKGSPFELIYSHIDDYEKVYSILVDDHSRTAYLGILNYKISLDNNYLRRIASPAEEQYFDREIVKLCDNEVICDCGSYNGDTLQKFVSLTKGKYKKYIAIEADQEIYKELIRNVNTHGYKNVQAYNVACWNEKTVLKFKSAQSEGQIAETGELTVFADTLDNILEGEEGLSFIKMDIEGAEGMALKGASLVIMRNKPILAICIYHRLEDFYKLPLMMKDFDRSYKLFIRHYNTLFPVETVCYAIPKERLV